MAKWKVKEAARQNIPTTFPDEIKPKEHSVYNKSGKRGRVFTGPQLAEYNEKQSKRRKRQEEINAERIRRHISLEKEDRCREEEEAHNQRAQMDQEDNLMNLSSYGQDVDQHAGALIVSQGGRDNFDQDLAIAVDSSGEEFPSVDQIYSMSQGERNIQSASERVISASQIVATSSAITTRASRGVLEPLKVQKELESQE